MIAKEIARLRDWLLNEGTEPAQLDRASKLPDNYLSARKAEYDKYLSAHKTENDKTATNKRYVLQDEIDALWRDLSAQFERAVLDGDAGWFEQQAKALDSVQQQEHARFNAAVVCAIEFAQKTVAPLSDKKAPRRKTRRESATLPPAGKSIGKTAHDVFAELNVEVIGGRIIVEGCPFESKGRALEAIRAIAQRLGVRLKKARTKTLPLL